MNRFLVTADAMGVPTAQVPLPLVWNLTKLFPAEKIVVTYHHETNHVLVTFPGWDPPTVQTLLDDLHAATAPLSQGFATWPGLHTPVPETPELPAELREEIELAAFDRKSETGHLGTTDLRIETEAIASAHHESRGPTTGSVLVKMRALMEGLTPTQQDRVAALVFDLITTLAAERLCFRKLFESGPDGYAATDFEGNIKHANAAMQQLLHVSTPHLDGKHLLSFFTPHSKALIQQRLRLLRTGISESQPFTDIQAQITVCEKTTRSVSMRLIAIKSHDPALSTIRWLIRSNG
jgi:PAS domain-containing protein